MIKKYLKKKMTPADKVGFRVFLVVALVLLFVILLQNADVALLSPKGLVAREQFKLMLFSTAVMMAIAVPTLFLLYFFAWKYRESNAKATYDSSVRHGKFFVLGVWAIPTIVMLVLATVMWSATHKLEPQKSIASDAKPLTIQVIALRWKWLFIYPEQGIASVNFVQVPTDTPIRFEITADEAPMNSFWIPHLGGQLYAMTGHMNPLNLLAETPGDYPGSSAEISGAGFAGMKFIARASSMESFELWVQQTKQSAEILDSAEYQKLLEPSENNQAAFYSSPESGLYNKVIMKYIGSHKHQPAAYEAHY